MAAGRLLLLLAAAQALHAPFPSGPRLAPARRGALARPPRVGAAVRLSDPPPAAGKLPFFLDINTKGGILFYSAVGIALPFVAYSYMVDVLDLGVVLAGNVILVLYVGLGIVAWTGSYVFRVANKDMTYAQQLKDYENAVIQKRFEELSEEEVDALMGEIYPEKPTEEKK